MVELYKEVFGFHFRVMEAATEQLEAFAYKRFDIEAWVPSKNEFIKVAETIHCADYPASRLNALYINKHNKRYPLHMIHSEVCSIETILMITMEYHS